MVSYNPLFKTLESKGISLYKMSKDLGLSTRTRSKFGKNENVSLDTLESICLYLDVPIEDVVEIVRK